MAVQSNGGRILDFGFKIASALVIAALLWVAGYARGLSVKIDEIEHALQLHDEDKEAHLDTGEAKAYDRIVVVVEGISRDVEKFDMTNTAAHQEIKELIRSYHD
jgi:hypothetical protein